MASQAMAPAKSQREQPGATVDVTPAAPYSGPSEAEMHERIAALAYELWQARGCPDGSPEDDWFRAEEELQAQN